MEALAGEYSIPMLRERAALAGDLAWLLWQQQMPIYEAIRSLPAHIDEYVVLCSRQFGKSHLGVLLAIEDAIRHRDKCILIIGPDTKQTKEIVNPRMRRIQAMLPQGLLVQSKAENKWIIYHDLDKRALDFSEIVIGGMNENSSSQRGKTVQTIYIEEVVDADPDDYIESLRSDLGPALTHSDHGKIIYLTTLPKVPDHPFITDTLVSARLNDAIAVFTIDDNKALSQAQYDAAVRRAGGRDSDDFKREYLCQVVRDRSVVIIPSFDEAAHVKTLVLPTFTYWNTMVDWGGVRDYTVGLLYTYDYLRNKLLVLKEFMFKENTETDVIWKKWWPWFEQHQIPWQRSRADAPGQTLVDINSRYKAALSLPSKDDWEAGINNLNVMFSLGQIEIDPSCTFLIESLRSGIFNKNRTDFTRTRALGHCDGVAVMIYAARHFDKTNPYPEVSASSQHYFAKPKQANQKLTGMVGRKF